MKSFAHALLGGPVWVDAQAQRLVDAGMYALMRRGISKASIRRLIGRAALCAFAATFLAYLLDGDHHNFWMYVVTVALVVGLAWVNRLDERDDLKEEATSMLVRRARFGASDRAWWWMMLIDEARKAVIGPRPKTPSDVRMAVFSSVAYLLFLVLAYSAKTPPRPPARKVMAPARLQEARAQ